MPNSRISPTIFQSSRRTGGADVAPRASVKARLTARLRYGRFDDMLAVGAPVTSGSALAVHAARLTSSDEREGIARSLRQAVQHARNPRAAMYVSAPLHRGNIVDAEDVIDAITLRLHSPRRVEARGMARLRRVLSDGRGPLYQCGSGDLAGRLGAALAAL